MRLGFPLQKLQRLIDRLMGETEGSIVHGHHPAGVQVEKSPSRVTRIRVHVAEGRRVIGSDRQQSQFRIQSLPNLTEARKVRRVPGVINRMPAIPQYVATV